MTDKPRLIERAFPLKQASLDSVHEKNVRHGHISTLHIWPARRPLAACRAALIATLLPDPGTPEGRRELCERIGGKVVQKIERKRMPNGRVVERIKEVTEGGILHWLGSEPASGSKRKKEEYRHKAKFHEEELEWFRQEIRKAYGGLPAPRPGLFFVYAIECEDGSHYIGQTDDLQRRWQEHLDGKAADWTKRHKPINIAHFEEFNSREDAVKRESDLKTDFGRKWLKDLIASGRARQAGRAPRVLDPFAGGGSIPLEAMRLGCEVTASDINPVAWFILKCTLEYPQKLAGKTHPLPDFILDDEDFMAAFYKAHPHLVGKTRKTQRQRVQEKNTPGLFDSPDSGETPEADLAWHVRAWGRWVLDRARRELAKFYPTYADFEHPVLTGRDKKNSIIQQPFERRPMRLVPLKEDGTPDIAALNAEFSEEYLADKRNPRWVAKPTVAYLWARTVTCKNCRATVPLLKTRWLCKKANKRVLLTMEPNGEKTGVVFGVENDVPVKGGNAAQRREHDKRLGAGTMSRAGAKCPCCGAIMTMEDIRTEGKAGRLSAMATAVVTDGQRGKEYRLPTEHERQCAEEAGQAIEAVFADVPFGLPTEPTPSGGGRGAGRAFSVQGYGLMRWCDLFTPRQLVALGTFVKQTRASREEMLEHEYSAEWIEAVGAYLASMLDRLANQNSTQTMWGSGYEKVEQTFARFALPIHWDYPESNVLSALTGGYVSALQWVGLVCTHLTDAAANASCSSVLAQSAIGMKAHGIDLIVTDPPYYDAIPYADLMDFFYVWLRRNIYDAKSSYQPIFAPSLGPKWDSEAGNGELIDDDSRHQGDVLKSKAAYEDGMARAFSACHRALVEHGRLVIVFANKQPDAWETLVSALIRSGFVVDGSWPIATEMRGGVRNFGRASLSSSVWLVCKKRPATARPGWDNKVLEEMRANIADRLREFWDAGIRGPDFVWAATGPALEAYSKHPVVKKANDPGKTMEVGEFLSHVRRMVVDFVVGRVLTGDREAADLTADRLDAPTAYYLLHRHDFGLGEAPSGACILYATACGLSDTDLESRWDILARTGGSSVRQDDEDENEDADPDAEEEPDAASGSKVRLRTWAQRKHRSMGYEAPGGQPVPLIDRVHRLMHLWGAGDVLKVDEYLDEHALRRHDLFHRLLQSLIELSSAGSDERSLLESLSNHVRAKGATPVDRQLRVSLGQEE